jgi:rubredoxin
MNCKTCKFWYSPKGFDAMGICRRFPATQNKLPDDWCGEFEEIIVFIKKKDEKK